MGVECVCVCVLSYCISILEYIIQNSSAIEAPSAFLRRSTLLTLLGASISHFPFPFLLVLFSIASHGFHNHARAPSFFVTNLNVRSLAESPKEPRRRG